MNQVKKEDLIIVLKFLLEYQDAFYVTGTHLISKDGDAKMCADIFAITKKYSIKDSDLK